MIPVRIQPAQAHEASAVLALIEALLAELGDEGQEFAQINRDELERKLEREMAPAEAPGCDPPLVWDRVSGSRRFLALLARDESDTVVGVLTLSANFAVYAGGEYGMIDEMYVLPEYRSQGIGRSLFEAAVLIARNRGWFRLEVTGPVGAGGSAGEIGALGGKSGVDTQVPGNPALRLYRRLGFEPTGQKLRLLV